MSKKYILACDSMTLLIKAEYFDFFGRSLVPLEHYWPIKSHEKCGDLKFAVEWGNNNTKKVSNIYIIIYIVSKILYLFQSSIIV